MFDKQQGLPIGSDHGGFLLKKFIIDNLSAEGYIFKDFGTFSEESVDYPDFIHPVAKSINDGLYEFGIIMCGSGQGASMTANKYPKVRAGLCWDAEQAKLIRLHNNANIIALPGRFIDFNTAVEMVKIFLDTEFEGGRHIKRVNKIPVSE
ncbi:MAG: ribose 5-phosphate isomerase B [Bacteroidetes bacterium 4484_249]|nr:MAG: ribose 5-phosphate isomerase B [Bacteroidetes bacterium 4484_249]